MNAQHHSVKGKKILLWILIFCAAGPALGSNVELIAQLTDPFIDCNATNCALQGACDWRYGYAHSLHAPQWADFSEHGLAVDAEATIAVDFMIQVEGPVTGLHFWGSFLNDIEPVGGPDSLSLEVSLYSDHLGRPGSRLWMHHFAPGSYTTRACHDGLQDWLQSYPMLFIPNGYRVSYQYDLCMPPHAVQFQAGTQYWLLLREIRSPLASHRFGLLSSFTDRLWRKPGRVQTGPSSIWMDLHYPIQHDLSLLPIEMALVLTGPKETLPKRDLGDAPDSSNSQGTPMTAYPGANTPGRFPTTYHLGSPPYGPLHKRPRDLAHLGSLVSLDHDADLGYDQDPTNNLRPPRNLANLDGADDALHLPLYLPHCQETRFSYSIKINNNALVPFVYVNAWFDWNRDGDWEDAIHCGAKMADEWALQNQAILLSTVGLQNIDSDTFLSWHPPYVENPDPVWMRLMLSEQPWPGPQALTAGAGPAGGYVFGETEDYYLRPNNRIEFVMSADRGDAPDDEILPGYPTLNSNSGATHRLAGPWFGDVENAPDHDIDGQPHAQSLGDDLDHPHDDEEGISIPPLVRGTTTDITLEVQGGGGIVTGWIDYDMDEVWQADEKVVNRFLPEGIHIVPIDVPDDAVVGTSHARFRISRRAGLNPAGLARDGEVEDHEVTILCSTWKWVQWPDVTPNSMGLRVDTNSIDSDRGLLRSVADDFECRQSNALSHVRLWGLWKEDQKGVITRIRLTIHPDDPVGDGGVDSNNDFSKPESAVLWTHSFTPGGFTEKLYHNVYGPGTWWWDRQAKRPLAEHNREIWQVDIPVDASIAFHQTGTPAHPVIYWLRVEILTENGEFAWCTRRWPDHFMDDAVWHGLAQDPKRWQELRYPRRHPYYGLEMDSIDMAFGLNFDDGPCEPVTARPHAATYCPAVTTRCPATVTQCPVVSTQCPTAATKCPAAQTQCPALTTRCPVLQTRCPAESTQCPPIQTQCPPTATECQMVVTECPATETRCPIAETKCPVQSTQCPMAQTRCPPTATECQTVVTECPATETRCPVAETKCPLQSTRCPVELTRCPPTVTECQSVLTECPATETRCPEEETKCPAIMTRCPIQSTNCPVRHTHCPEEETRCPAESTRCPYIQTQCPPTLTECHAPETECPAVKTRCPPRETHCPISDTKCPVTDTRCPVEETQCPVIYTRCPPTETRCPPSATKCPPVDTQCPPTGCMLPTGRQPSYPGFIRLSELVGRACPIVEAPCLSVRR